MGNPWDKIAADFGVAGPEVQDSNVIKGMIRESAQRHGLDPELAVSQGRTESNFDPSAVGKAGEKGLFQFMDETAGDVGLEKPFNVEENIDARMRHFDNLLNQFGGDKDKALAAYNAGARRVHEKGGVPSYAQGYVNKVKNGMDTSVEFLNEEEPLPSVQKLNKPAEDSPNFIDKVKGYITNHFTGHPEPLVPFSERIARDIDSQAEIARNTEQVFTTIASGISAFAGGATHAALNRMMQSPAEHKQYMTTGSSDRHDPIKAFHEIAEVLQYNPKSERAMSNIEAFSIPFERLDEIATVAGENVTKVTDNPTLGALTYSIINVVPMLYGPKLLKGGGKGAGTGRAKYYSKGIGEEVSKVIQGGNPEGLSVMLENTLRDLERVDPNIRKLVNDGIRENVKKYRGRKGGGEEPPIAESPISPKPDEPPPISPGEGGSNLTRKRVNDRIRDNVQRAREAKSKLGKGESIKRPGSPEKGYPGLEKPKYPPDKGMEAKATPEDLALAEQAAKIERGKKGYENIKGEEIPDDPPRENKMVAEEGEGLRTFTESEHNAQIKEIKLSKKELLAEKEAKAKELAGKRKGIPPKEKKIITKKNKAEIKIIEDKIDTLKKKEVSLQSEKRKSKTRKREVTKLSEGPQKLTVESKGIISKADMEKIDNLKDTVEPYPQIDNLGILEGVEHNVQKIMDKSNYVDSNGYLTAEGLKSNLDNMRRTLADVKKGVDSKSIEPNVLKGMLEDAISSFEQNIYGFRRSKVYIDPLQFDEVRVAVKLLESLPEDLSTWRPTMFKDQSNIIKNIIHRPTGKAKEIKALESKVRKKKDPTLEDQLEQKFKDKGLVEPPLNIGSEPVAFLTKNQDPKAVGGERLFEVFNVEGKKNGTTLRESTIDELGLIKKNRKGRKLATKKKVEKSEVELEKINNRMNEIAKELDKDLTDLELTNYLKELSELDSKAELLEPTKDTLVKTKTLSESDKLQKQSYDDILDFLEKKEDKGIEGFEYVDEMGKPTYEKAYEGRIDPDSISKDVSLLTDWFGDEKGSIEIGWTSREAKNMKKVLRQLNADAQAQGSNFGEFLADVTRLSDKDIVLLESLMKDPDFLPELNSRYVVKASKKGPRPWSNEDSVQSQARMEQAVNSTINSDYTGFYDEMVRRKRIVQPYVRGSKEIPAFQEPIIEQIEPKVLGDIPALSRGGSSNRIFHYAFDQSPFIDWMEGQMAMSTNIKNSLHWVRDVLEPVPRETKAIRVEMAEIYKKYAPLINKRNQTAKKLKLKQAELKKTGKSSIDLVLKRQLEVARLKDELKGGAKEHSHMYKKMVEDYDNKIGEIAEKYSSARVTLQAGEKLPKGIKLSPAEMEAAGILKDYFNIQRERMVERGLKVTKEPYMTHLWVDAMESGDTLFMKKLRPAKSKQAKLVLNFMDQAPNSRIWLPDIHEIMSHYIPMVERKLAFQPFHTKWEVPKNMINQAEHPRLKKFMDNWWKYQVEPEKIGGFDKFVNGAIGLEYMRLIGLSMSVGTKHLMKLVGTPTNTGFISSAKAIPKALKLPFDTLAKRLSKQGAKTEALDLYRAFSNTRTMVRALDELPMFGAKKGMDTFKSLVAQPTVAIEAFDNGVSILATIAKGRNKNMPFKDVHKAVWDTILDANFRGADRPAWQRTSLGRMFTMFQQTPFKLLEFKWHLIKKAARGEKDMFGTHYGTRAIRYVTMLGMAESIARSQDTSILELFLHPPFMRHLVTSTDWNSPSWEDPIPGFDLNIPNLAVSPAIDFLSGGEQNVARNIVDHFKYMGSIHKFIKGMDKSYPTDYYSSFWKNQLGLPMTDMPHKEYKNNFWEYLMGETGGDTGFGPAGVGAGPTGPESP